MESVITNISAEYLFGPIQPIEIDINTLFESGDFMVDSLEGTVNPYRQGVVVSEDKMSILYLPQNDDHFWDEHLSSDTVNFTVKNKHTKETVSVSYKLTRFLNDDYFPGTATLNIPENVASHIRMELPQFFKYAPFEVTRVVIYDKRIFSDVQITGADKTNLDLFLVDDKGCFPDYSEMYLLVRNPETGDEAFTVIYFVWSKASFFAYPKVVEVSDTLPVYILSPVTVNNNQSFTITGVLNDAPERGALEAVGTSFKYTFNLDSGFWDANGASDLIGGGVTNGTAYSANSHKIIKVATSEVNADIATSDSIELYNSYLLVEEALTPDGTYGAPYFLTGTMEIKINEYYLGVPFSGVVNLIDPGTIEIVPDAYSSLNFAKNTTLGGTPIVSGELAGFTGTIAVDEDITFSNGTANT